MKKIFTLFAGLALAATSIAQTTEYETGQVAGDPWTGWSTPVTSNCSGSVNGANVYAFTGTSGQSYTLETYRQFNINSSDIDIYLAVTAENATVSIEHSTDGSSYTQIGTQNWGAGFSQSTLTIPTVDPQQASFYLKIKVSGTFGSPSQCQLNTFKIDAVLNSGNSVSIAPASTQNIEEGQNGTTMTATESPSAASSREWKYSTTSGSGYMSFGTAETGTTYTPNFATAGTYYVICESDFSGDVQTSNEVQINVTAPASVEEFELGSNVLFSAGILNIITAENDYTVSLYDLSGKLIDREVNMTSYDFSALKEGVYMVNILTKEGESKTFKIAYNK